MMNRLMSTVERQVMGLKIQAGLFQPTYLSVKISLMLVLVLSRRSFGTLFIAGIFFLVILHPALHF